MVPPAPRHSMDSLSPTSPNTFRAEFPARAGASGRYHPRGGSIASSAVFQSGTFDGSNQTLGLQESGQNAIYTLLQPPIVRTESFPHTSESASATNSYRPPTTRDIPPVKLSTIPIIDAAEFRPYLTQVEALFSAIQRAKESEDEHKAPVSRKTSKVDDVVIFPEHGRRSSSRSSVSRQASITSVSSIDGTRRRSSGSRRAALVPTPLSTIPNVYFEENFHLENPRTFDVVSERSELVKSIGAVKDEKNKLNSDIVAPRKALATNAILQEKLSWYMDTIEIHLINSISSASKSFFTALGSLRELHTEASMSVDRTKALRKELLSLDENIAVRGLSILNMKQRKENLKTLGDVILQLKTIIETVAACECMVENGELEKALDSIEHLERLLSGEHSDSIKPRIRDLREVAVLRNVANKIDALRSRVGKNFEIRLLNTLMNDLRRHVDSTPASETLQRWSLTSQRSRGQDREKSSITYLDIKSDFRSELSANLHGLHRARHISAATVAYRESILREMREIVRRKLPASNDDDIESIVSASTIGGDRRKAQHEKSAILARNLRSLGPNDAEELLQGIYVGISETLRRLGTQVKVLLDIISTLGELSTPITSPQMHAFGTIDERLSPRSLELNPDEEVQEEMHVTLNMSNLLGQSVDIAQEKIVKLLRVRSEQTTHLPVRDFLRYFTLNLLFANECEAVSGRGGTSLKNVVNNHIKDFTRILGESERQSLATGMEADSWNAKDFTEADNEVLSCIISSSTQDPQAWSSSCHLWQESSDSSSDSAANVAPTSGHAQSSTETSVPLKATSRPAVIESESFILPNSAIMCLHGLASFLHLNTGIPSMASEIASSIISYLTLFNSRCTQLILGAGATRSAGLKNITTKHLALASQALSFITSLIPHIREFLRRQSSSLNSTLMAEFDKIRRAYLEHQQSIYDKLVDIMVGRATAHAKSMRAIDWSKEKEGVNAYMETLTKETSTLHRVLSKHLPEATVNMIIQPVLGNYKEQWSKAFEDVLLVSENAKERLLRDAEWFRTKIRNLDNSTDTGDFLVNLVKEKVIPKSKVKKTEDPGSAVNASTDSEDGQKIPA